jgi:hypothetical protein
MDTSSLDALIVANIGELEAAIARVKVGIDPKLNAEAWDTLKRALSHANYHFEDDNDPDDAWFAPGSWLDDAGDSDPWFRLTARDGSARETWLACYADPKSNSEAIGIQWYCDKIYVRDYKAILDAHVEQLDQIGQAGFVRDGTRIYFPISFDAVKISDGFREGDLTEALAPISSAAEALEMARPSFQSLRDAIVLKAKG